MSRRVFVFIIVYVLAIVMATFVSAKTNNTVGACDEPDPGPTPSFVFSAQEGTIVVQIEGLVEDDKVRLEGLDGQEWTSDVSQEAIEDGDSFSLSSPVFVYATKWRSVVERGSCFRYVSDTYQA